MPDMDVDPPDRQTLCCKRYDLFSTIESEEILVSNFNEVINVPDTPQNYQMKRNCQEADKGAPATFFEKSPISLSFSHPAHCSIQSHCFQPSQPPLTPLVHFFDATHPSSFQSTTPS
ncbi:hypothetical protein TNCT_560111 [Trichonephila clavata]|uniref:Uncharacterized protein n=1 Tax=Trichonephila clavata TaxID=2740835 RepID=A0A8X6KT67_TRICU|nr:hypothetical protein TNCT_560111 [Trichonephila clavata]